MILYSLWSNIFIIRIIIIIIGNKKKLNSIFDTESKIIQFMGSNKYIITKIKCWPVFKQDPLAVLSPWLLAVLWLPQLSVLTPLAPVHGHGMCCTPKEFAGDHCFSCCSSCFGKDSKSCNCCEL